MRPFSLLCSTALVLSWAACPSSAQVAGFRKTFDDFVLFDADDDPTTEGDQIRLSGQAGIDIDVMACSSWITPATCQSLVDLRGTGTGVGAFTIEADASGSVDHLEVIDPGLLSIIVLQTGGLLVEMRFLTVLQVVGNMEAGARLDFGLESSIGTEFEYDPGFEFKAGAFPPDEGFQGPPELTGSAAADLSVRLFAAVEFQPSFGATPLPGPSLLFGPRMRMEVEPSADPWWRLTPGLDVFAAFGRLGIGYLIPPTQLQAFDLPGQNAGGAVGDPGQEPVQRWAKTYDVTLQDNPTFAVPGASDPSATMIGLEDGAIVEVDIEGNVLGAWDWMSGNPKDAVVHGAGHRMVGSLAGDGWIADFEGFAGFPTSERLFFHHETVDWIINLERILELPGGGHIVAGYASAGISNTKRRLVARIGVGGNPVWANLYGCGMFEGAFQGLELASDGNLLLLGMEGGGPSGEAGISLDKLSTDGSVIWSTRLQNDILSSYLNAVVSEHDSTVTVKGVRGGSVFMTESNLTLFTLEFDLATGAKLDGAYTQGEEFGGVFGLGNSNSDAFRAVVREGNTLWLAEKTAVDDTLAGWIWATTANGAIAQIGLYEAPLGVRFEALRRTPDGGLLTVGNSIGLGQPGSPDLFVVKSGVLPLVGLDPSSNGKMRPVSTRKFAGQVVTFSTDPVVAEAVNLHTMPHDPVLLTHLVVPVEDVER